LNYDTDHVDQAAKDDSPFTTNSVGNIASDNRTEESTSGKNTSDEGGVRGAELGSIHAIDLLVETFVTEDTIDVPRVISEEDTTEGGKGTEQIGLPGDWGFDARNIVGRTKTVDHLGGLIVEDV